METSVAHPRDVLAWHGLSGVCMVLMVFATVPGWLAGAGIALFAAGLLWCGLRLARQGSRAAYLRLGVCCLAMLVMLATPRHPSGHMAGDMPGDMPGHMHGDPMAAPGPSVVALAVTAALVAVALLAARRPVPTTPRARAAGGLEAAVALAMAAMLVGLG
jgi:hypothetical protein